MIYCPSVAQKRRFGTAVTIGGGKLGKERPMASSHLDALSARHASLEGQIAAEMLRPLPDATRISKLKRQKLRLKEEVASLGKPS